MWCTCIYYFVIGIHVCLPDFLTSLMNSPRPLGDAPESGLSAHLNVSQKPVASSVPSGGTKLSHIIRLLCHYASFLTRGRGDIEAAAMVYAKGMELDPTNATLVVQFAHFLAEEEYKSMRSHRQYLRGQASPGSNESSPGVPLKFTPTLGLNLTRGWTVDQLYSIALKLDPNAGMKPSSVQDYNPMTVLGYAKYLRKTGRAGPAEIMYGVAYQLCTSNAVNDISNKHKFIPMAICNYATFLVEKHKAAYMRTSYSGSGQSSSSPEKITPSEAYNRILQAKKIFEDGLSL